jgi:hypothetical protein
LSIMTQSRSSLVVVVEEALFMEALRSLMSMLLLMAV